MKNLHKLLSVLKNGCLVNATLIEIKYSKTWVLLLKLLYLEGYIQNFIVKNKKIIIFLRYYKGKGCIRTIKSFIKPSRILYIRKRHLWAFNRLSGTLFMSTTLGVKSHIDCLRFNLGGKLLFFIG